MTFEVIVIGGGMAGSEASWQLANAGFQVKLYEMRTPERKTFAHQTHQFAELVCSNSFRNCDINSAIGLLHEEMRRLDSLIITTAEQHRVPAGGALAVDRDEFSKDITNKIYSHPNISVIRQEVINISEFPTSSPVIIATGPLTSDNLSVTISTMTGSDHLAFFDAIAPIVYKDTIDFDIAWFQSRYDKTGGFSNGKDYINCPMNKDQYYNFIDAILAAPKTEFKEWEKNTPYFDGCLPIEVMAERGRDTLLYGPMKPVGLFNPHTNSRPYAVVQLRQDNKAGSLFNIVGFQTKLKYGSQTEIFRMIPGLERAEFARLGGIHRNTFINSPKLLNPDMSLKQHPNIYFAGQITGVEGYVESAASGLALSRMLISKIKLGKEIRLPRNSAMGSLVAHITGEGNSETFQPMNINYGLIPELEDAIIINSKGKKVKLEKSEKRARIAERSLKEIEKFSSFFKGSS